MVEINKSKPCLILGAYGRCGLPLVDLLDKSGYTNLLYPTKNMCNLLDNHSYEWYFSEQNPHYVINLIGKSTSIKLCEDYPASIARDTLLINTNVIETCRKYKVEKLVNVICSCSYGDGKDLLVEQEFWDGSPHESIRAHGESKRMVYYLGQSYSRQYNMNVVTIALNNVFNHHDWSKCGSPKFLDSIIQKVVTAKYYKEKTIELWGTGSPRREAIYNVDAAAGIKRVFESYNDSELINIGTGWDLSIREWAELIKEVAKWRGEIIWRKEMRDGQMIKLFNIEKQLTALNWMPPTDIREAIKRTIQSYTEYLKG